MICPHFLISSCCLWSNTGFPGGNLKTFVKIAASSLNFGVRKKQQKFKTITWLPINSNNNKYQKPAHIERVWSIVCNWSGSSTSSRWWFQPIWKICSSNWIMFPLFSWWKFKKYLKLPTKQDHPSKWLVSPLRTGLLPTPSKAPPFNAPQHSQGVLRRTARWSGRDGFFVQPESRCRFFCMIRIWIWWYVGEFGDDMLMMIGEWWCIDDICWIHDLMNAMGLLFMGCESVKPAWIST